MCVCVCVISCVYLLSVTVENNSSKDMGRVIAEFMQTVEFYANKRKKRNNNSFSNPAGKSTRKGEEIF